MKKENLIPADTFCEYHKIEFSFIRSLQKSGLIEIKKIEETTFLDEDELQNLEKMIRLHYDLDINIEGIEAVLHLLEQMENMQQEMTSLKNRLRLYQNEIE